MNIDGEHARFSAPKRPIVFVLGGPGSGKGTQCEMLVEKYGWKQICAGELLRAEAKRDSELGRMIKEIIDGGNIVPGYVTIELLDKEIQKTAEGTPGILIDGFPRAFDQAVEYEKRIGEIDLVVYFSCSIETMRERLLGRGKTSGRVDDCSDVIESRFRTFLDTSMPVIQKYSAQGILNEVPSEGSPDEIFESLCVALRRNELLPS
ncbi:Adenylate kinase isoenzyme 1 [Porphyridium purpureum]|uniref:Adenylate kinase isoenzyme 1 n=1 Tax=Porphyridium purpureum TaxID=35688 RepID=A0A5J4YX79_PORPP|nr:Adenylate kinase isoenzyme 1 [Porphyridium purpureum]|eukprot:POR8841..scf209_3